MNLVSLILMEIDPVTLLWVSDFDWEVRIYLHEWKDLLKFCKKAKYESHFSQNRENMLTLYKVRNCTNVWKIPQLGRAIACENSHPSLLPAQVSFCKAVPLTKCHSGQEQRRTAVFTRKYANLVYRWELHRCLKNSATSQGYSLQKQPSFFAPSPSGVSREGRNTTQARSEERWLFSQTSRVTNLRAATHKPQGAIYNDWLVTIRMKW